ncbi:hypothetical protein HPP92_016311 [Vanilla planifolia]|uniref:Ubiquitin thioesterase OTU n=1 Tax=Vanilla planifolia TaxID=51239 RepID=A0A835QAP6_VANPL|nr:hypothetical protein HPP92_016311 [Vanilla planifolia]
MNDSYSGLLFMNDSCSGLLFMNFGFVSMEGVVVRRVIPSDNSCLFNAVGYVMDHDKHRAQELRQVIAMTVASDPIKYNEAFLGKPNEIYCAWILNQRRGEGLSQPKVQQFNTLQNGQLRFGESKMLDSTNRIEDLSSKVITQDAHFLDFDIKGALVSVAQIDGREEGSGELVGERGYEEGGIFFGRARIET